MRKLKIYAVVAAFVACGVGYKYWNDAQIRANWHQTYAYVEKASHDYERTGSRNSKKKLVCRILVSYEYQEQEFSGEDYNKQDHCHTIGEEIQIYVNPKSPTQIKAFL